MFFLLKKPLIYSWKYYKILWFTCLFLGIFAQLVTLIPLVKAEGSRELVQYGGNRPYLLFGNEDSDTAGILSQATLKVFVKAGETVHLGSSVENSAEINGEIKDIVYRWPGSNPPLVNGSPGNGSFDVDGTGCGFISTLAQETAGPLPNPGGYTPCSFLAQEDGIYEIEFHAPEYLNASLTNNFPDSKLTNEPFPNGGPDPDPNDPNNQKTAISAWDITVMGVSGQEIPGRVYANYLPLGTKGNSDEIHSQLVILSKAGHEYQINLNGIQPIAFILFANNKGFIDTSNRQLFKSVWLKNAPSGVDSIDTGEIKVHHPSEPDDSDNITHKIFLNKPDSDLPLSANTPGGDSTWLHSIPPSPPTVSNFTFTGSEGTPNQAGTTGPQGRQFSFEASRAGNYFLTIDVNQNGDFGDDSDRVLTGPAIVGANPVAWDGLDGQGSNLPIGVYQAKLVLSTNEVHFPFFDVENNPNGLIIERLTSCSGVCDVVYYDDSDYQINGNSMLEGENSSSGAHIFPNNGFGNNTGIDTWTSITAEPLSPLDINIKEVNLEVTKTHSPNSPVPGGAVTYTIEVKSNDGNFSDVTGIRVEDVVPSNIIGVTWTCTVTPAEPGNNCAQTSGTGNINTTVDLKKGAIATFILQGIISGNLASGGNIDNTVTITTPDDVTNNPDGKTENADDPIILGDPPSQPPVANDDSASTPANTATTIPVLGNDTDDNNSLDETSVTVTTPPNNGTTQVINGEVKYTPNTNFSGTDTFSYKVCDTHGLCDLATVTITITSSEPPPPPPPPPKKLLSVTIDGKGTVTSNPGRIDCHIIIGICALGFETNTLVTLSAEPDPGWEFKEWQQDCDNNGEVTLNSDKQCEAIFVQVLQLTTLTVSITGQGSVTAITPPDGIDCGDDCSHEYAEGTSVVLKATPATGWIFKGWQGDCNEKGEVTLVKTNVQCQAIFEPDGPSLIQVMVYKTGQGKVTSEPSGIECGETCFAQYNGSQEVQLIATPDPGWKFEGWRGHCDDQGQVTSLEINRQCRAIFTADVPSSFQVTVYKTGQGKVTSEPSGIECGETCSAPYEGSQEVQLIAIPDPGWKFEGWRGHCDKSSGQVIRNNLSYDHAQCRAIFLPNPLDPQSELDGDQDGVPTTIEDAAPNNGDGNSDGIPDSQQNNVISLPSGEQYVTVAETNGCVVDRVQAAANDSTTPAAIDLNLSCSQANFTTYSHIQGQPVAVESFSLSDGGSGDSIAGDGKITHTIVDEDDDGISTTTENAAPNNGDGNNDGIPDSQQNNVISLLSGGQYVTVAETNGCVIDQVRAFASDPTTPAAINLNFSSCSQANLTTYSHIQGQPVVVESFSLSDGGTGDSIAGDGKITHTITMVDEDDDGILTTTENAAPNNGDGNNDGIPDSQQNNVISLPSGKQYVTVEETNGCVVDQVQAVASNPTTPATINLNISCSQAKMKIYRHGINDLQNVLPFQSVPSDSNPNITQWQALPVTHDTIMIQGQPVAVESFSLSDGGIGDSIAGDGKIIHTSGRGPLPTINGTLSTDSSSETISLSDDTTGSVSNIIGQEIDYPSHNNTPNDTVPSTISHCLSLSPTATPSLSWNQIIQVGETTTITLDTGSKEFFIQAMPDPNLVSVEGWQFLNGKMELSLTGLNTGDTQMILSDSNSSQQAILYLTVIAISSPVEPVVLPLVEKPVTTLQTVVQVEQNIDLAVKGGQGSLSITQMPDSYLVLLTNWQSHTDGTANFTLTGLNAGDTSLVITDGTTPPQKTHININILANELRGENQPVTDSPPTDNVDNAISCQGDTLGIDLEGHLNQACFIGNIMSWGDLRSSPRRFTATEAQNTRVTATVLISPEDIGKTAQILLVGQHTNSNGETTRYIRDDSRDQYSWERWNGQITQIPPSQYYPQLPEIIDIFIYEGDLSMMSGEFTVYVGYQLSDNTVIYNGLKPIQFWVSNN
jgi:uncharacterized repeat protein (TIGR01451 family)